MEQQSETAILNISLLKGLCLLCVRRRSQNEMVQQICAGRALLVLTLAKLNLVWMIVLSDRNFSIYMPVSA